MKPNESEELFYIIDTRQLVGNCVLFWGPDRKGYVCEVDKAGLYSRDEAMRQQKSRETDRAIPKSVVDAGSTRHFRAERFFDYRDRALECGLVDLGATKAGCVE